jgi:Ca-activated chloride channel family protein
MISHAILRGGCRWLASAILLVLPAAAQTSQSELPSAPSAVAMPKKQPPAQPTTAPSAAPATTPATTAPAQSTPSQSQPQQPVVGGTPSGGPTPPPAQTENLDAPPTIIVTANEVNMVFTATDKHGRFIKDLKQEDIQVTDDSKPVGKIRSFSSQTDLPLQVALLVDASNSVRDRFKFEQEAAIEFLNQIIRPNYDKAFVVGFDATPEVTQDFTDNSEFLAKGVRSLKAGGGTAMFDAIYFSCRDKLMNAPRNGPVRRAVILLSDGDDNLSHVSREETIEMAQRAEVIIYTISTNISGSKNKGDKILERLSEATGGRAFFPFKIQDVADAFTEIQDELRSQYALSYHPPDLVADGRFRPVEITAVSQKNLHVRSRHGYYAPSPKKH